MVSEDDVALMVSVAYSAPYIDGVSSRSILYNREVLKLVEMREDDVREYIVLNGVKPLSADSLSEDAYILYNNTLVYIGRFEGGCIPSEEILKYRSSCLDIVVLHTHPIPLPLPTPEDVVSTQQVGYSTECILSRINRHTAKMVCIKPAEGWGKIIDIVRAFAETVYKLIDRYLVVEDELGIMFIPYPSEDHLYSVEGEFVKILKGLAYIDVVTLDMKLMEYTHSIW